MDVSKSVVFLTALVLSLSLSACSKKEEASTVVSEASGNAQQLGDVLASIDESGASGGSYASLDIQGQNRIFARYVPSAQETVSLAQKLLMAKAHAASCALSNTWGSCTSNVITRSFDNCSLGAATVNGSVQLTFNDGNVNNTCTVDSDNDSIVRVPDFTITASGASYKVSKTGSVGQQITRTSNGVFAFSNDGVRRVISFGGVTLFDGTTTTTSDITIKGTNRNGRTMNGGGLRVTNNTSGVTCDYVPANITWANTCNCPVSGSLSGTCSDGRSTSLTITGCGEGTITLGSTSESATLDRCVSL